MSGVFVFALAVSGLPLAEACRRAARRSERYDSLTRNAFKRVTERPRFVEFTFTGSSDPSPMLGPDVHYCAMLLLAILAVLVVVLVLALV